MIWFTEVGAGKVGRLDPETEKFSEFQLPTPHSQPQGIVLGADGAMWGTEAAGNRIFRIEPDGHATEFPIPTPNSVPVAIAPGRGGLLWVSELSGGKLLSISRTGKIREFPLPRALVRTALLPPRTGTSGSPTAAGTRSAWSRRPGGFSSTRFRHRTRSPPRSSRSRLGEIAFTEFVSNRVGVLRCPTADPVPPPVRRRGWDRPVERLPSSAFSTEGVRIARKTGLVSDLQGEENPRTTKGMSTATKTGNAAGSPSPRSP